MSARPDRLDHGASALLEPPFLLTVPPFPGARLSRFEPLAEQADRPVALADCIARLRAARVGGTYWGRQPDVPANSVLFRSAAQIDACGSLVAHLGQPFLWPPEPTPKASDATTNTDACDPWHMVASATGVVCAADDPLRFVAALAEVPLFLVDPGTVAEWTGGAEGLLAEALPLSALFANPFGAEPLDLLKLIELCGFWRALIDSNRDIRGGVGFAFWKQDSVLPLLWGGGDPTRFFTAADEAGPGDSIAIWRSKAPARLLDRLEQRGATMVEVEDGFLRSAGLGADCVPPLSLTVDRLGPYFDPAQPSELEHLLEHGSFPPALLDRAARLREAIVAAGLGKYERSDTVLARIEEGRRHVLVTGQVEDDRSILTGGAGLVSNLELLRRVRACEPDSFVIYKPHPDVLAGHRTGAIDDHDARGLADLVVTDASISSLIAMVDAVHVNTSLAGFEALMRHKEVVTHGVPFYAGWGLTRDLGPVPERRTQRRSLDELVAATLLLYPRYLDPVTGLPCPAEVVVERLCRQDRSSTGVLVSARRLQGRLKRGLKGLVR